MLGILIPFALGFVHAFYPIACWVALAGCIAIAWRRGGYARSDAPLGPPAYVSLGALLAVAWPPLVRPLLDGDSLSYHLPNAAAWVQAHSLWTTATQYWWYPPASELFASGVYATSGPFALPWCGVFALGLLALRIAQFAREVAGAPPLVADLLGAATITAFPLAIQGGTLQNDVWLAAFFVESFAAPYAAAVTALIKPQGWLLAGIALIASRAPRKAWLAAGGVFGIWILHDVILLPHALISLGSAAAFGAPLGSTIVAHGLPALALLVRVMLVSSPFALIAFVLALFAPAFTRQNRAFAWAACAAALLFLVLPFGYATAVEQLATGASLRFAAPAIALGALLMATSAARNPRIALPLLLASTLYGVGMLLAVFWNDGSTHFAVIVALVGVSVAALAQRFRAEWMGVAAMALAIVFSGHLAARHPLDYYADALAVGDARPGVYRWIEENKPPAIAGWGLRLGVVNVLAPATRTFDAIGANACAQASLDGALLVAVAQNDLPAQANSQRLANARACGSTLYDDPIAAVARPRN